MINSSENKKWRLDKFSSLAQFSELVVPAFVALVAIFLPQSSAFLKNPSLIIKLCLGIIFYHGLLFVFSNRGQKKFYYVLSRYGWLVFFLAFIYVTGSIDSQYIFLLIFPLLAASVDLESKSIKLVGFLSIIVFAGLIFLSDDTLNQANLIKHSFHTVLFVAMVFYVYRIVIGTINERYERDKARRQLAESVELERVKADFLMVASHQLRTPLGGAKWGLEETLTDKNLSRETANLIQRSYEKIKDANRIVEDMLKAIEGGGESLRMNIDQVNLGDLLKGIVDELGYLALNKNVEVSCRLADASLYVIGDLKLLRPAITNVIDNAVRYSPQGKVEIDVSRSKSNELVITVKDTGVGISKTDQEHIFERFYRGANAVLIDPNESGVGLYSTKKIIDLHHGEISFVSTLGQGTTFTIKLPAKI